MQRLSALEIGGFRCVPYTGIRVEGFARGGERYQARCWGVEKKTCDKKGYEKGGYWPYTLPGCTLPSSEWRQVHGNIALSLIMFFKCNTKKSNLKGHMNHCSFHSVP